MKLIVLLIALLVTIPSYCYTDYNSTTDYFNQCQTMPSNKNLKDTACYAYFLGILNTMLLYPNKPCFKMTDSDRDIYKEVMKTSMTYLHNHPGATSYTSATILAHSLIETYPCTK